MELSSVKSLRFCRPVRKLTIRDQRKQTYNTKKKKLSVQSAGSSKRITLILLRTAVSMSVLLNSGEIPCRQKVLTLQIRFRILTEKVAKKAAYSLVNM